MTEIIEDQRRPLSRLRAAVAKTVTASAAVPQFTIDYDVRTAALATLRKSHRISWSDAIIAAAGRALRAYPRLNASWAHDAIVDHASVNVGVAIALEDGLVAPAVCNADRLSLIEIATERHRLTSAARNGVLTPADLFSATFTVSNLGSLGVARFSALVLPPQAAILAVSGINPGGVLRLTLTCDHRVVDGFPAGVFLRDLVARLEEPSWLI